MNWLLIFAVLLVAGNIVWGFFRGFLRVVYSMVAWLLILVFVTFATPYVAEWLTDHTKLDTRIEQGCRDRMKEIVAGDEKDGKKGGRLDNLKLRLPDEVGERLLDTQKVTDDLLEKSGLYQTMASKASSLAMRAIAFLLVMVITMIAFHLIAVAIDLVAKLPVIGGVNHLLGGAAGALKGIVILWLIFAFAAMGAATEAGSVLIHAIYGSPVLQWLYENNLLLTVILSFL